MPGSDVGFVASFREACLVESKDFMFWVCCRGCSLLGACLALKAAEKYVIDRFYWLVCFLSCLVGACIIDQRAWLMSFHTPLAVVLMGAGDDA
ncbi:hypothetical protein J9978_02660 [Chromobacterium violaceum]|uniref:hypothetical protein n=1 Tax=Chromobacterium violaceum TaxID=536 RepID=UPI00111BD4BE|nr:hypothetical protein [Chromobacterium violaceum]MBP4048400.1 hypothetical protein [Chromobacterium violaceum]